MAEQQAGDRITQGAPVLFSKRFASSETFKTVFREGMALVESTASYLDGQGRTDSRGLPRGVALTYATESMRLTTRLMQLASWLLLQRAVNDGEMTAEQALAEKAKVRIRGFETTTDGPGWDALPAPLRDLVTRSRSLQDRILRLDAVMSSVETEPAANPVGRQLGRLVEAFGGRK